MIDFACKKFDFNEVVKCGFGLTKSEFLIFEFLRKNRREFKTIELARELNLEISTVQKAVKKIYSLGCLVRKQRNQSQGGYFFVYRIENQEILRSKLMLFVSNWFLLVKSSISNWS